MPAAPHVRTLVLAVAALAIAATPVLADPADERRALVMLRVLAYDEHLEYVADTGSGIAPDALARIFQAGFTTKPKGHGYGLHSSALAAEAMGGGLECTSEGLGHGAKFVPRVPHVEAKVS